MFRGRHPNDDALVRRYMAARGLEALRPADERVVRHLEACTTCGARYAGVCADLDGAADAAVAAADAEFPAERLLRQRDRILRRLDATGARVIAFPANEPGVRERLLFRPRWGWVAAAAAAGLVVGILAGRVLQLPDEAPAQMARSVSTARIGTPAGVRAATLVTREMGDEFLWEVETAIDGPRTAELEAIDAMTLRTQGPPPLKD